MIVHANLDVEARWAGVQLPRAVAQRISLYGALVGALADGEDVEVWAPVAIDASRLRAVGSWTPPRMRAGVPARADLRWADPDARAANDRRLARTVAALPGAWVIAAAPAEPDLAIAVPEVPLAGPWVAKAPWTTAGRDRCIGDGPVTTEQRARLARLLRTSGELLVEPWCDRIVDAGVCATVDGAGGVVAHAPHTLISSARGGFVGIELAPPGLEAGELLALAEAVDRAGAALHGVGYAGPFAIDAFAYRDGAGMRRFHPVCEINARYTFGWIARALGARLGIRRLGFDEPPAGAHVLIAPAGDGVVAWCA